jgi:hypothetical protein
VLRPGDGTLSVTTGEGVGDQSYPGGPAGRVRWPHGRRRSSGVPARPALRRLLRSRPRFVSPRSPLKELASFPTLRAGLPRPARPGAGEPTNSANLVTAPPTTPRCRSGCRRTSPSVPSRPATSILAASLSRGNRAPRLRADVPASAVTEWIRPAGSLPLQVPAPRRSPHDSHRQW